MRGKGKRDKGHGGEREFAKDLTTAMKLRIPIERNVDQVRQGGADIIALAPFAIEVKRQEALHISAWRIQAIAQTSQFNPIPVLAYRQNNKKWVVEMLLADIGKKKFSTKYDRWLSMTLQDFAFIAYCIINR